MHVVDDKFKLQEQQYRFPYHHIPYFDQRGIARRHRVLGWAWEYLCYQQHIRERVRELSPKKVLEVGCGDGYFIGHLGDDITQRVGADLSRDAIRFARAYHPDVTFHEGDAADLDPGFDVVVAIEVLEHVSEDRLATFIKTLFHLVRISGTVLISVPTVVVPLNRKHYRHYTAKLLTSQLAQAGVAFQVVRQDYIFHLPMWLANYIRLTNNRYWLMEPHFLTNIIWRHVWRKLRVTDESRGRHLMMMFERTR